MLARQLAAALTTGAMVAAPSTAPTGAAARATAPTAVLATAPTSPGGTTYEYYRYTTEYGSGHLFVQFRGARVSIGFPGGGYACMSGERVAPGTWRGYQVSGDGLDSGSITSAITVRRSAGGTQLSYTTDDGTTRGKRSSLASAAREAREMGQTPSKVAGWCSGMRAQPKVKAVSGGDQLTVTVDPASSAFTWQVAVQRRGSDGRWRTRSTIGLRLRIRGDSWTGYKRTLDLPKGTYRAVVKGVRGFPGGASPSATLTR